MAKFDDTFKLFKIKENCEKSITLVAKEKDILSSNFLGETKPIQILDFLIECKEDKFFTKQYQII